MSAFSRLLREDWFAVLVLCAALVFGQHMANKATQLAFECEGEKLEMLQLELRAIEAQLVKTETALIELKTQLIQHDRGESWKPFDGPEVQLAADAAAQFQKARDKFEADAPQREQVCNDIGNLRDQNVLLVVLIGAILTFLGFRVGKRAGEV